MAAIFHKTGRKQLSTEPPNVLFPQWVMAAWSILLYAGYPKLTEPRPRPMKLSAHPSPEERDKEAQPDSFLPYILLVPPEKLKSGLIHTQPRDLAGFSPHPFPPPGSRLKSLS